MKKLVLISLVALLAACASNTPVKQAESKKEKVTVTGKRISKEEFQKKKIVKVIKPEKGESIIDALKRSMNAEHYPDINDYATCKELIDALVEQKIPILSISDHKVVVPTEGNLSLTYDFKSGGCVSI